MRNKYLQTFFGKKISLLFAFFFILFFHNGVQACVDYHPQPFSTIVVDSFFNHIEVTVHNMHLFGGSNGEFCTCAFGSFYDLLTDVYYIAFVDSGTTNPIDGFEVWQVDANATAGWSAIIPGNQWEGFVAAVSYSGLPAGKPVDLIVRANLPDGYDYSTLDSAVYTTSYGTDAADPSTHYPSNMHQSVTGLGSYQVVTVSDSYFTGIQVPQIQQVSVFLNQALDEIIIRSAIPINKVELITMNGAIIATESSISENEFRITIQGFSSGLVIVNVATGAGITTKKVAFF
jgi:hypothetical protein